MLISGRAHAQSDTAGTIAIEIQNAETMRATQTATATVYTLIGNVQLKQGENFMSCDSAHINQESNNVEAFGSVHIIQPGGTEASSDYLRYTGNTKMAWLKGNVSLSDGENNLWAEELEYNLGTKVGVYHQGGTLQSEATTLSSNSGTYNAKSKDARFTGDVLVSDPEYNATSQDLGYNTVSKLVRFYAPSVVISDGSELRTSSGTWDGKNEIAHFTSRSSIRNAEQYIEADKMDYNRHTGFGEAVGNVMALDTAQKTTLFSGYAAYNQLSRKLLATINPVMKQVNNTDSIYIRADTFYSAPVSVPTQTPVSKGDTIRTQIGKSIVETKIVMNDTVRADSSGPRFYIAFHHVLVFSDSLQARCDSISYTQVDSVMRLMSSRLVPGGHLPVAWSRSSQITGDTILLYQDSSRLRKLYVPNNAFVATRSGPEKAGMYDQIQGKTLTGYFENGAIHEMVVWPGAEAIYYSKDDDGAYLGVNQAQSERMRVLFRQQQIDRIILEQEVKQTMTPLQQVSIINMRLSRFLWLEDKRPRSIQELFLYEPYPKPATESVPDADTTLKPSKKQTKKK